MCSHVYFIPSGVRNERPVKTGKNVLCISLAVSSLYNKREQFFNVSATNAAYIIRDCVQWTCYIDTIYIHLYYVWLPTLSACLLLLELISFPLFRSYTVGMGCLAPLCMGCLDRYFFVVVLHQFIRENRHDLHSKLLKLCKIVRSIKKNRV